MIKKFLAIFLAVISIASISTTVFANDIDSNTYVYPVNVESQEWKDFNSRAEKANALQIPIEALNSMKTSELLDIVLDYPLLSDVFAFNNTNEGLNSVASTFNGLSELLNRNDFIDIATNRYKNMPIVSNMENRMNEKLVYDSFYLEIMLASDLVTGMTNAQESQINIIANEVIAQRSNFPDVYGDMVSPYFETLNSDISTLDFTTTIKTSKGTSVSVEYRDVELDSAFLRSLNEKYDNAYPNATRILGATRKYNCHAYAWYSTSSTYWMNNPSAYMEDGSYVSIYSPTIGDIAYYKNGDHSARFTGSSYVFKSKWGQAGVYEHQVDDCPYPSDYISYWRSTE